MEFQDIEFTEKKFRAWSNSWDVMVYPDSAKYTIDVHAQTIWDDCRDTFAVLMQFTGLKDKAGKDIYEGDKLKTKSGSEYVVQSIPLFAVWVYSNSIDLDQLEVIGNIHED